MSDIETWSETAALNNDVPPDGAPENGVNGEDVNDIVREQMRAVRKWYGAAQYVYLLYDVAPRGAKTLVQTSSTSIQVSNVDVTALFTAGMRVQIIGVTTEESFVTSAVFASPHTVITINGGTVPATPTNIGIHIAPSLGANAFGGAGTAAARTAAYSSVPTQNGVVWLNTDTGDYEVSNGGAWVPIGHISAFSNSGGTLTLEHASNPEVRLRETGTPETRGILEWAADILRLQSLDATGTQTGLFEILESDELPYYSRGTNSRLEFPRILSANFASLGHLEVEVGTLGVLFNWGMATMSGGSGTVVYDRAFASVPWGGGIIPSSAGGSARRSFDATLTNPSQIVITRDGGGTGQDYFFVVVGPQN